MSRSDTAMCLGVTLDDVDRLIEDGTLLAVRFAAGIRVVIDADDLAAQDESTSA